MQQLLKSDASRYQSGFTESQSRKYQFSFFQLSLQTLWNLSNSTSACRFQEEYYSSVPQTPNYWPTRENKLFQSIKEIKKSTNLMNIFILSNKTRISKTRGGILAVWAKQALTQYDQTGGAWCWCGTCCSSVVLKPSEACIPPERGSQTALFMRSSMRFPSSLVLTSHFPVHATADWFMDMVKHSQYPPDPSIL